MELTDLSSAVEIAVIAIFSIPVVLAGISIVIVVANRAEPDASGRRPLAVYLFAISFVALFAALLSSWGVVRQLCRLIAPNAASGDSGDGFGDSGDSGSSGDGSDGGSSGFSRLRPSSLVRHLADAPEIKHPLGDSVARGAVGLGIVLLLALAVLLLHLRAGDRISRDELSTGGPVARVRQSYVAAVSFLCVVIVVASLGVAVYRVFSLIAPTVFDPAHPSSHAASLRTLIPALWLAVTTAAVLVLHVRATPPGQRPDFSGLPFLPFGRFGRQQVPTVDGAYDLTPAEQLAAPLGLPAREVQVPLAPPSTARVEGGEEIGDAPSAPPRKRPRPRTGG